MESLSVLVDFQSSVLALGRTSFPVRPYVPPPATGASDMGSSQRSAAENKGVRSVEVNMDLRNVEEIRCSCGGHGVTYKGCEIRKKAIEIQKIKSVNNMSRAEAVKRAQSETGGGES